MKKLATIAACTAIAAVGFAPAAFARHKVHHHAHAAAVVAPAASPVMDAQGQFYATPVSAGPADLGELRVVPGLDLATGVVGDVGGAVQPVLAIPEAALQVPGAIVAPVVR